MIRFEGQSSAAFLIPPLSSEARTSRIGKIFYQPPIKPIRSHAAQEISLPDTGTLRRKLADFLDLALGKESAITREQLIRIPEMQKIIQKFILFQVEAKNLARKEQNLPEYLFVSDEQLAKEVLEYVLRCYDGDLTRTFQSALREVYLLEVESIHLRQALEKQIYLVQVLPTTDRLRKPTVTQERLTTEEWKTRKEEQEQEAWCRILGITEEQLPIEPIPEFWNQHIERNLRGEQFELRYLPALQLGTLKDLQRLGVADYLEVLEDRYPGWRRFELLTPRERKNPKIRRMVEAWYWELVRQERTPFPQLTGRWVAVETMPKPWKGSKYKSTIDNGQRFGTSGAAIEAYTRGISPEENSTHRQIHRLPTILEWNLLALREGWGESNTFELTSTPYYPRANTEELHIPRDLMAQSSHGNRGWLAIGSSEFGGAASVSPESKNLNAGYRWLFEFVPKSEEAATTE